MSERLLSYLIPLAANLALVVVAKILKWLTVSGSIAALAIGFLSFYYMGPGGWFLLLLFFVTSNVLGIVSKPVAVVTASQIQKKRGCRDWIQVLANGGLAGAAALYYGLSGAMVALVMFGSALAESTADTWAGEAGILSKKLPISIRTGKPVPVGMSGGISLFGTLSAFVGSLIIAMSWYGAFAPYPDVSWLFLASIIAVAGMVGSFVDSFLGATVQGQYWDPENKQVTEHEGREGVRFELCRGIRWIDNDVVNFISNAAGVLVGWGLSFIVL